MKALAFRSNHHRKGFIITKKQVTAPEPTGENIYKDLSDHDLTQLKEALMIRYLDIAPLPTPKKVLKIRSQRIYRDAEGLISHVVTEAVDEEEVR